MPEGHTVHRVALQLEADLVGRVLAVSSPQGRFAAGAALLDGMRMTRAWALGKHLLVTFRPAGAPVEQADVGGAEQGAWPPPEHGDERHLRVHLGLYGAWDLGGVVSPIGHAAQAAPSLGAPRVRRTVHLGEVERSSGSEAPGAPDASDAPDPDFPPEPVGAVRLRLLSDATVADLRGPSRCELITGPEVAALVARSGPDPRVPAWPDAEQTFVDRVSARRVAVGQLLMDQSVVAGIGNIYRAEILFRAGLNPLVPGRAVPAETLRALWQDWAALLDSGVREGVMVTRGWPDGSGLSAGERARAIADRSARNWVYGRAGQPCLVCGTPVALAPLAGRTLFWCPTCQPA